MKHSVCTHCHDTGFFDFLDPNKNGLAASARATGEKIRNEFTNPNSVLRGQIIPKVAAATSAIPGVGQVTGAIDKANKVVTSLGYDMPRMMPRIPRGARFDKHGKLRPKRKPSARILERNAIVLKYRKDHGVSLIDASRAVKEQGLFM